MCQKFSLKYFHKQLKIREIKDLRKFSAIRYVVKKFFNDRKLCKHHKGPTPFFSVLVKNSTARLNREVLGRQERMPWILLASSSLQHWLSVTSNSPSTSILQRIDKSKLAPSRDVCPAFHHMWLGVRSSVDASDIPNLNFKYFQQLLCTHLYQ